MHVCIHIHKCINEYIETGSGRVSVYCVKYMYMVERKTDACICTYIECINVYTETGS